MPELIEWFGYDTNPIWSCQHLYNPNFALHRLTYSDVYTKLQILGWINNNNNPESNKSLPYKKVVSQLFQYCATIPNEWRHQLNLKESKLEIDIPAEKWLNPARYLESYSDQQLKQYFETWLLSEATEIIPDLNIILLLSNKSIDVKSLLSSMTANSNHPRRRSSKKIDYNTLQTNLWAHYHAYNSHKWEKFVDYKDIISFH